MTRRRGGKHGPRPTNNDDELQRCSWRFWDEPDDTNHGPQIVVTEPNGAEHYLIDLETFWSRLRQRSERLAAESARESERAVCIMDGNMDDMLHCTFQDTVACEKDEGAFVIASGLPSTTTMSSSKRGQRVSTRLKQAFSRRTGQPRGLLPLYHDGGDDGSRQSEDSETERLLGCDDIWDDRPRQGVEMDLLRLFGVLGLLRTIAYCCSRS